MNQPRSTNGQPKLDHVIIGLLITGVAASIVLEIIGMVLFYRFRGSLTISTKATAFIQGHDLGFLAHHVTGMIREQGIDIFFMTLGIIVLILTPLARVIVSIAYFAFERDVKFLFITLFVLAVLSASLLIH